MRLEPTAVSVFSLRGRFKGKFSHLLPDGIVNPSPKTSACSPTTPLYAGIIVWKKSRHSNSDQKSLLKVLKRLNFGAFPGLQSGIHMNDEGER